MNDAYMHFHRRFAVFLQINFMIYTKKNATFVLMALFNGDELSVYQQCHSDQKDCFDGLIDFCANNIITDPSAQTKKLLRLVVPDCS